ncbi:hypothetical protein [Arthrobacter sp. IK3]|uniref:hypothetical protein n=1 Tax=Arthrobacter sp. IK3 TaxID=3448169 RepID=UPI003EE3EE9E
MTPQEDHGGAALAAQPLDVRQLDALPVLSVVLNTELNPHAWQKRLVFTEGGARRHQWFCTTDSDWGENSEQLVSDWGKIILLWLPSGADIAATERRAELAGI